MRERERARESVRKRGREKRIQVSAHRYIIHCRTHTKTPKKREGKKNKDKLSFKLLWIDRASDRQTDKEARTQIEKDVRDRKISSSNSLK